ncbi:uncharacterized protein LOC131849173 [Achroia grisella]|uniref:uncharacterized protein LOC131849173 n=1 Tax=Achroia grisella TaxID=688607 RepID=UPI0027D216B9|nr:uncharacterized protein LOC131849173 [Achroia grisella]
MTDQISDWSEQSEQQRLETFYENKYMLQRNQEIHEHFRDHRARQIFIDKQNLTYNEIYKIHIIGEKQNGHIKHTTCNINYNIPNQPSKIFGMQEQNFKFQGTHIINRQFCGTQNVNVNSQQQIYKTPFINSFKQTDWEVYRCQLNTKEESCCCSCNSDAMFEVMKSLYDCYKKKNCDNCNCILCGHLPREERRFGELRKSGEELTHIGVETASANEKKKENTKRTKKAAAATVGKTSSEKEKILTDLVMTGAPLPVPKTASEKELIKNIETKLGLPPKPKTLVEREKYKQAEAAGLIAPLEGKSTTQKEKLLRKQAELGIPLPEGRTESEKSLIKKVQTTVKEPSEKLRKQKTAGYLTPLKGKTLSQKEKILKQHAEMGLSLPEGRTLSEKALITKFKDTTKPLPSGMVPSEKLRKAKAAGFITPLEGKTSEEKEKILRGLAINGIPLLEGKTASEKKLIAKVRADIGLPPEPKTASEREKYNTAIAAGIITPLEQKTLIEKEKILRRQAEMSLPLPEGRTASEKALISKVKATTKVQPSATMYPEKLHRHKTTDLVTHLEGKSPEQKEKILKNLVIKGVPLPEGKTVSEKKIISKVQKELDLPLEPKVLLEKTKYDTGLITPRKFAAQKEKILKQQAKMGLSLPEGRTLSEKSLIDKVKATVKTSSVIAIPSEKFRKAKDAGFITPIDGKTAEQKEKILRGLAIHGIPLPKGKTASEKKIIAKVRNNLGLPSEPKTLTEKINYNKAIAAGVITPLEGKLESQKESILRKQVEMGIPLPEGRSSSEKALISKIKTTTKQQPSVIVPSEKLRKAKAAGFITPLEGKPAERKKEIIKGLAMHGAPLPKGKTLSEKKLIEKVRADIGLPPEPKSRPEKEKYKQAIAAGLVAPLEGKSMSQKRKILKGQADLGISLPNGRTPSEKALIQSIITATVTEEQQKQLRELTAEQYKKLDEKTALIMKERKGPSDECICSLLTPESQKLTKLSKILKESGRITTVKLKDAKAAGLLTHAERKAAVQKEKNLKKQAEKGIALPEERTSSDKDLMSKVITTPKAAKRVVVPSEKLRSAKAAGLITPLEGKTLQQKEYILKGLATRGLPLPDGKTSSEKKLIAKVRNDLGLPPQPKTTTELEKYNKAMAVGVITPLKGKTTAEKEKILNKQAEIGLSLPEGQTRSEKALIAKIKTLSKTKSLPLVPSEKLRKARAAGLITPIEGKTLEQKEKILRGLATQGIPLPEGKTRSEKKLITKVRNDIGLPPAPKTPSQKVTYSKAMEAGLITPLEGKTSAQKERILRQQAKMGLLLPEGRTASERALVGNIRAPSGIMTPLKGKTVEQREEILRSLAKQGIPLPEGKTRSEKKLISKVRIDVGLLPGPKTASEKVIHKNAVDAGLITSLKGKTSSQNEKILKQQAEMGLILPEGRTSSEKALISSIIQTTKTVPSIIIPSKKLRKAKDAGLITPLERKTPEQKEKILKGLAVQGIHFPEGKSSSEQKLIDKVRRDLALPPMPDTLSAKEKYKRAMATGLIMPLEGKSALQKEKILTGQVDLGIPLPEGRTPSEKALIEKVKVTVRYPSATSQKIRKAKAAGLEGKTLEQKKRILKDLVKANAPLPDGKTASEKELIRKVRNDMGLPPESKSQLIKEKMYKAQAAGLITPLEGKSEPQKKIILKNLVHAGVSLPEGRTTSEKALISQVRAETESKLPYGRIRGPPALSSVNAEKLDKATVKVMKEGKGPSDECICALFTPESQKETESLRKKITSLLKPTTTRPLTKAIPSEKIRKVKAAGLLKSLEGKSPKEKIIKYLAAAGSPITEGKTASENAIIQKVKTDFRTPSQLKIVSEKEIIQKAKEKGILTPLTGKTAEKKEKKIRGLAEPGLLVTEGMTGSAQEMVKNIKMETISGKKRKLRVKSKKNGVATITKSAKGVTKLSGGMEEEFEDVIKTTTCDRGCGCDKKKIRFKHSYVKIRVTSPDISSLCPCPNECVPGIKNGVFTDNEGIKVTVGRVSGVPSYMSNKIECNFSVSKNRYSLKSIFRSKYGYQFDKNCDSISNVDNLFKSDSHTNSSYDHIECVFKYPIYSTNNSIENNKNLCNDVEERQQSYGYVCDSTSELRQLSNTNNVHYCSDPPYLSAENNIVTSCSSKSVISSISLQSIVIIKSETSLRLSINSYTSRDITNISVISFADSNFSSEDSLCFLAKQFEEYKYYSNKMVCVGRDSNSTSECSINNNCFKYNANYDETITEVNNEEHLTIQLFRKEHNRSKSDAVSVLANNLYNKQSMMDVVKESHPKKSLFHNSSVSIFFVISSSDCVSDYTLDSDRWTMCTEVTKKSASWSDFSRNNQYETRNLTMVAQGLKISAKRKQNLLKKIPPKVDDIEIMRHLKKYAPTENKKEKIGQTALLSTDTTSDRSCCCSPRDPQNSRNSNVRFACGVDSKLILPIIASEDITQGLTREAFAEEDTHIKIKTCYPRPFCINNSSNQRNHSPVKLCSVSPCCAQNSFHRSILKTIHPSHVYGQTCNCSLEKNNELIGNIKEMKTVSCGDSNPCPNPHFITTNTIKPTTDKNICTKCGYPKIADGRNVTCQCSDVEKKVKLKPLCPCEIHKPPQLVEFADGAATKPPMRVKKGCKCPQDENLKRKQNKNTICECPQQEKKFSEDLEDYNKSEWIDIKKIIKMQSDITQTTSGFKFDVVPRPPLEPQMTFEEALQYYAEHPTEDLMEQAEEEDDCSCINKPMSTSTAKLDIDCECLSEPEITKTGKHKGFKLQITGKGSASKGLSGVCCFDMVQHLTGPLISSSRST